MLLELLKLRQDVSEKRLLYTDIIIKAYYKLFQKYIKQFLVGKNRINGRKRSSGFLRVFTVAFLLFLTPTGSSNPAGHSLTLT